MGERADDLRLVAAGDDRLEDVRVGQMQDRVLLEGARSHLGLLEELTERPGVLTELSLDPRAP
jgi:hypothetical protein